jgi:hypothetical protein
MERVAGVVGQCVGLHTWRALRRSDSSLSGWLRVCVICGATRDASVGEVRAHKRASRSTVSLDAMRQAAEDARARREQRALQRLLEAEEMTT